MKNNLLESIEEILLMGPGPSCIHPKTYDALSCKTLGHLDPYLVKIMDEIMILHFFDKYVKILCRNDGFLPKTQAKLHQSLIASILQKILGFGNSIFL
jgi:hypothetical protein